MKYFYEVTIQIMAEDDDNDAFAYSVIQTSKEDGSDAELIAYGETDTPKQAWEIVLEDIGARHVS